MCTQHKGVPARSDAVVTGKPTALGEQVTSLPSAHVLVGASPLLAAVT